MEKLTVEIKYKPAIGYCWSMPELHLFSIKYYSTKSNAKKAALLVLDKIHFNICELCNHARTIDDYIEWVEA